MTSKDESTHSASPLPITIKGQVVVEHPIVKALNDRVRSCHSCLLAGDPAKNPRVPTKWPTRPPLDTLGKVVVITPRPSDYEVEKQEMMVGPRAIALAHSLRLCGVHPDHLYFTAVSKCGQFSKATPAQANDALTACFSKFLFEELAIIRPDVLVLFGESTFQHIMQRIAPQAVFTNGRVRSFRRSAGGGNVVVASHYHPGFYFHSGRNLDELTVSIATMFEAIRAAIIQNNPDFSK